MDTVAFAGLGSRDRLFDWSRDDPVEFVMVPARHVNDDYSRTCAIKI